MITNLNLALFLLICCGICQNYAGPGLSRPSREPTLASATSAKMNEVVDFIQKLMMRKNAGTNSATVEYINVNEAEIQNLSLPTRA